MSTFVTKRLLSVMVKRRRYRCFGGGLKKGRTKDVDGPMTVDALGPKMTKSAFNSRVTLDSDEKKLKLKDAPVTSKSNFWTHFSFNNISGTNNIFVFMYVMYEFCILQSDRYRDVSLHNCLAMYCLPQNCCIVILSLLWAKLSHYSSLVNLKFPHLLFTTQKTDQESIRKLINNRTNKQN